MKYVRPNPKGPGGEDVYDPRLEQTRAQRQAIYETSVVKIMGEPSFRRPDGLRLDVVIFNTLGREFVRDLVARHMFAKGTGVQQRTGYIVPGTQQPTPATAMRSWERYQDIDHLIRNRQDYEETLAIGRQGGFYRVLAEPGAKGMVYTIWPMPPDASHILVFKSGSEAEEAVRPYNRTWDPRDTRRWWKPPARPYTLTRSVKMWLPPPSVFQK